MRGRVIQSCVLAILSAVTLNAQPAPSGWNAVMALPAGTPVTVIHGGLKRTAGTVIEVTAEELTIQGNAGASVHPRASIQRVSRPRVSRQRRVLAGAALGAGVGLLTALVAAEAGDVDIRYDLVGGVGAAVGAAAGAGHGAATAGPLTVYRAP